MHAFSASALHALRTPGAGTIPGLVLPTNCDAAALRRDVLLGRRGPGDLWRWLGTLPDANGRTHGVAGGSLEVSKERSREDMKPTAASLRQAAAAAAAK